MVNPRSKTEQISETTKDYLLDVYVDQVYGRHRDITNKYIEKGNWAEEDSLSIVSKVKNQLLIKNKQELINDYVTGTPDVILPDKIIDIKTCWDIHTFIRKDDKNKDYYWQLQGYMWLTGIKRAELIYTLVDSPDFIIFREYSRQAFILGLEEGSEEMIELEDQIRKEMTFGDIPEGKRVKTFTFDFDPEGITKLTEKILLARNYLNSIDK